MKQRLKEREKVTIIKHTRYTQTRYNKSTSRITTYPHTPARVIILFITIIILSGTVA